MLSLTGATGYDATTRRRVRRASARARPWLLPVAVVVAALLVPLRASAPAPAPVVVPVPALVPPGRVLVAVTPSDPAVLGLARPGVRVDVYAAAATSFEPGDDRPARLVAVDALVVDPDGGADGTGSTPRPGDGRAAGPDPGGAGGASGGLAAAGVLPSSPSGPAAVTLAVTDAEAADLAARPGSGLTLAVRGPVEPP
ncbi:hypothetical protein [Jannaschia sp. R86511]|uniref:hypothetical protein n=1 Tax=Jannaschia sp. R86511 TaxID=3093853 RepID=UPI0036D244F1